MENSDNETPGQPDGIWNTGSAWNTEFVNTSDLFYYPSKVNLDPWSWNVVDDN
jgi:hypothetical protein